MIERKQRSKIRKRHRPIMSPQEKIIQTMLENNIDTNLMVSPSTILAHSIDIDIDVDVDLELDLDNNDNRDDDENDDDDDDEESVRIFYEEFQQSKRPFFRNFSISELSANSNESSPLLNPSKSSNGMIISKEIWLQRFWRWYEQRLNQRPLFTKAITSGIMTFIGDIVGQCVEMMEEQSYDNIISNIIDNTNTTNDKASSSSSLSSLFDWARLARFCTMGMFVQAPVTHYYYVALDHYLPPTTYPWTPTTLLKPIIDQTIYAPIFLFLVIVYLGIIGGSSFSFIGKQLKYEYMITLISNWKLWVPATVYKMAYIPPEFRVLYCNVIFFGWSIYLSLALNNNQ